MNDTVIDFLSKNEIDVSKISLSIDCVQYQPKNISYINYFYAFSEPSIMGEVCIEDILSTSNIKFDIGFFKIMGDYFDKDGSDYHKRSLGMLEYNTEEIVEKLSNSFIEHPISVNEIEKGKYIISYNGLHRYYVLKAHFLKEMVSAQTEEEKNRIRKKYTIPVKIQNLNYLRTYCNYIIHLLANTSLKKDYLTNELFVIENGMKKILTDEELIEYTRNILLNNQNENISDIKYYLKHDESFKEFFLKYYNEIYNSMFNTISI